MIGYSSTRNDDRDNTRISPRSRTGRGGTKLLPWVCRRDPDIVRRLNGIDALMLYLDGGSAYNHTLKISVLDPSTDPDGWSWPKARRMFSERVHLLPVFRLRYLPTPLNLHHPIWVDDPDFDLDAHVRRVVCPAPGGMEEFCDSGRTDLRPPAGPGPPALADLGGRGPRGRPGRPRDHAAPRILRRRRRAGHACVLLQRLARRFRGVPGAVGAAGAADVTAAAGLGPPRHARQTPQSCADRTGTARSGAHRARIRQSRRGPRPVTSRPFHTAGPVPGRPFAQPTVFLRDVRARRCPGGQQDTRRHDQRRLHGVCGGRCAPSPRADRLSARRADGGHDAARGHAGGRAGSPR